VAGENNSCRVWDEEASVSYIYDGVGLIEGLRCYMLELLGGLRIDSSTWGLMMMGIQQPITLERYVPFCSDTSKG
jgi:hypothetical protein